MKLCSKCKTNEALSYHRYCYTCLRVASGRTEKPKFNRDPNNTTLCSKCKKNPRSEYHRYCVDCRRETARNWIKSKGGSWKSKTPEQKHKATVRKYVQNKIKNGDIIPQPCKLCGALQNIQDRVDQGRNGDVSGEKNGRSKLTQEQVQWIRSNYSPMGKEGLSSVRIAKILRISQSTVSHIVNDKTWSDPNPS